MAISDESESRPPAAPDDNFKTYCDHHKELENARQESATRFDKYLLAGAGGALALSVSLLGKVGARPVAPCLLLASWFVLAMSAGCVLTNFHLVYVANGKAIALADETIRKESEEVHGYDRRYSEAEPARLGRLKSSIRCLNVAALALLAIGIILLVLFGWYNL